MKTSDFGRSAAAGENGICENLTSMSRRRFLKNTALAGAAMALPFPMQARAADATLRYMCWEGYNDPAIIGPFEQANSAEVKFDLIVDSPAGFAKLAAGGAKDVDLISTDSPWVARMGPTNLCEFIDPVEFADVFDSFYPQFKYPFAPLTYEGKMTGIPTRWGWVGPTVNTETSSVDEWRSYDACFDSKNKDKIGIMDWGDWPIMPMALHAGIDPYKELDQAELDEVRKVLRALFKNSRALFSDLSLAQKAMLDGSVKTLIGTGSYTTSALRKAGYKNILTVVPEPVDGFKKGIIWLEATAIVKGTSNPDLTKKLVKYMASTDAELKLSYTDFTCNPTPNRDVEALYTDEQKAVLQLDYAWEAWDKSVFHTVAPNVDDLLAIWQEELASAQ